MNRIADALELLTAQHDEIDALIAELSASGNPAARNQTISALVDKLTTHLALEQELLYPAVASALTDEVHAELIAEHAEIKRILADMLWLECEDARFSRKLTALQGLVGWHSTWQERHLFEATAEQMSEAQLADLGAQLNGYLEGSFAIAA